MTARPLAWDAHAHWFAPHVTDSEARAALARAWDAGLTGVFLGGIGPSDWDSQRQLAAEFPDRVIPCFGLHPWWVHRECGRLLASDALAGGNAPDGVEAELDRLQEWVNSQVGRFGIGEIGLDASQGRGPGQPSWDLQRRVARRGLELAEEHRVPAVLHGVDALPELLALVREVFPQRETAGRRFGLLHRFSGSLETAREFLKQGFLISVSPAVARPHARRLHRVVLGLLPGELLFESDGPDAGDSVQILDSARAVAELHRAAGSSWSDPEVWLETASQSLLELWSSQGRVG